MRTRTKEDIYLNARRRGFITGEEPVGYGFCAVWVRKHPDSLTPLRMLRRIVGHNPEWSDLSDDVLSSFRDELKESNNISQNTARRICAELKAILNANVDTKFIPSKNYARILRFKQVATQSVYLDSSEIRRVEDYEPENEKEDYVKSMFLIEALTGARISDSRRLTMGNVREVFNPASGRNEQWIVYVAQKTREVVNVPANPKVLRYLTGKWNEKMTDMPRNVFNDTLRDICRKCKINKVETITQADDTRTLQKWEFVSSHTGRRSFATRMAMKGATVDDIAKFMGHTKNGLPNINMTKRYIMTPPKPNRKSINIALSL